VGTGFLYQDDAGKEESAARSPVDNHWLAIHCFLTGDDGVSSE